MEQIKSFLCRKSKFAQKSDIFYRKTRNRTNLKEASYSEMPDVRHNMTEDM